MHPSGYTTWPIPTGSDAGMKRAALVALRLLMGPVMLVLLVHDAPWPYAASIVLRQGQHDVPSLWHAVRLRNAQCPSA